MKLTNNNCILWIVMTGDICNVVQYFDTVHFMGPAAETDVDLNGHFEDCIYHGGPYIKKMLTCFHVDLK